MSYIRKLPSGKWQATVRGPDGRKHTKSDPLKKVVTKWATDQESKFNQGDVRNPRPATSGLPTGISATPRRTPGKLARSATLRCGRCTARQSGRRGR